MQVYMLVINLVASFDMQPLRVLYTSLLLMPFLTFTSFS